MIDKQVHFFLYTFSPILTASFPGMDWLPSLEAMMIVFPDVDGPKSFVRSTFIVKMFSSIVISTFFILALLFDFCISLFIFFFFLLLVFVLIFLFFFWTAFNSWSFYNAY